MSVIHHAFGISYMHSPLRHFSCDSYLIPRNKTAYQYPSPRFHGRIQISAVRKEIRFHQSALKGEPQTSPDTFGIHLSVVIPFSPNVSTTLFDIILDIARCSHTTTARRRHFSCVILLSPDRKKMMEGER